MNFFNSRAYLFFKSFEKKAQFFYSKIVKVLWANFKLKLKIRRYLRAKSAKKLTRSQIKEIRSYYRSFNINGVSTSWHKFYSACYGTFSVQYVPENLFYTKMEPELNPHRFLPVLADKNLLSRLFKDIRQAETVIKNINGFYYRGEELIPLEKAVEYCDSGEKMVIKPTMETRGGKNVLLFNCNKGMTNRGNKTIEQLFKEYKKDFIIQKAIEQHPKMSALNASSVNTFKVMTFLKGTEVFIFSTIVRMGKTGSFTDNVDAGGISCGVEQNGVLKEGAYQYPIGFINQTDSGIRFKKITLPFMAKIEEAVTRMHKSLPYFRLISWDLAIDTHGEVVLIEHNVIGQEINLHQMYNGPVLSMLLEEFKD